MSHTDTELPKYAELDEFLARQCVAFETTESWSSTAEDGGAKASPKATNFKKANFFSNSKKSLLASKNLLEDKCACCSDAHTLFMCTKLKEIPVGKRVKLVHKSRLCFDYFLSFHMTYRCKSKLSCLECKRKHNTLLHYEKHMEPSKD